MFAAPFIIMRNTLRGRRLERRRGELVMVSTVIAGLWSLMSGTVVVMALQALLAFECHCRTDPAILRANQRFRFRLADAQASASAWIT